MQIHSDRAFDTAIKYANILSSETRDLADVAINEALEEAATLAETEGVSPELNISNGGPVWFKHGKRIASGIRALKHIPTELPDAPKEPT